jgi:hypothetical protein
LIQNPIQKVLSTLSTYQVRYLLMGGQACVFYGAAEFSRDCDVAILCEPQNLARLQAALDELQARTIAVPPFEADYLLRGHAVHFRCQAPNAENMRLDVMARMRGVADFDDLWSRRTTLEDERGGVIELMSLQDLVAAKKTQRDKDWPMIRRLIEANYAQHRDAASDEQIRFWLLEARTPEMLIELAARYPEAAQSATERRALLSEASTADRQSLRDALAKEQEAEREADRIYWEPLKRELEKLRRGRR